MIALYIAGGLIALMALGMVVQNNRVPANLGQLEGKLHPMPASPNAVSSQTDDREKLVAPLPFSGDAGSSLDAIEKIIKSHGATVVRRDGHYIHAVYTTRGMKFKDDVEFLAVPEESLVHFRSASRVGHSDMGVNRKRYEKIAREYGG